LIEIEGDIWTLHTQGEVVAVTTGGMLTADGRAVLGRGLSKMAGLRFPWFARQLGEQISTGGNHVYLVGERLIAFPVEESPFTNPDPRLIGRSATELTALADQQGWQRVIVPRPGCGSGGLSWREVKPLLETVLDHRFCIISPLQAG
jgi:hypothetical protein